MVAAVGDMFDWGESVKVTDAAPPKYRELETGGVSGMRVIENEAVAQAFGEPIGSILYLVEG